MTLSDLQVYLAAILSALKSLGEPAPEGPLYLALQEFGASFDDYQKVKSILLGSGLVVEANNLLSLTKKGQSMAAEIDKRLSLTE